MHLGNEEYLYFYTKLLLSCNEIVMTNNKWSKTLFKRPRTVVRREAASHLAAYQKSETENRANEVMTEYLNLVVLLKCTVSEGLNEVKINSGKCIHVRQMNTYRILKAKNNRCSYT